MVPYIKLYMLPGEGKSIWKLFHYLLKRNYWYEKYDEHKFVIDGSIFQVCIVGKENHSHIFYWLV